MEFNNMPRKELTNKNKKSAGVQVTVSEDTFTAVQKVKMPEKAANT